MALGWLLDIGWTLHGDGVEREQREGLVPDLVHRISRYVMNEWCYLDSYLDRQAVNEARLYPYGVKDWTHSRS